MADPTHSRHVELSSWLRDVVGRRDFDPKAFDEDAINTALASVPVGVGRGG
jgi:hypothetical protein